MKIYQDESQNIEYKESWNDKYLEWLCGSRITDAQSAELLWWRRGDGATNQVHEDDACRR